MEVIEEHGGFSEKEKITEEYWKYLMTIAQFREEQIQGEQMEIVEMCYVSQ